MHDTGKGARWASRPRTAEKPGNKRDTYLHFWRARLCSPGENPMPEASVTRCRRARSAFFLPWSRKAEAGGRGLGATRKWPWAAEVEFGPWGMREGRAECGIGGLGGGRADEPQRRSCRRAGRGLLALVVVPCWDTPERGQSARPLAGGRVVEAQPARASWTSAPPKMRKACWN